MSKRILTFILALIMVALLGIGVGMVPAASANQDIQTVTMVYHAKGGIPGPPNEEPPAPVDNSHFELMGPKWDITGNGPVSYVIDPDYAPAGAATEIEAAFEAWDAETDTELFNPATVDSNADVSFGDGINTVAFRILTGMPKALAVTVIEYDDVDGSGDMSVGDLITEADMIFNLKFEWAIDPDGEGGLTANVKGKYYDIRDIATHEAGHVVGLDDLYGDIYRELTMYGYAGAKETNKISLEAGDIAGAQYLYD